jgi:broad specificity phosphatase PhoE
MPTIYLIRHGQASFGAEDYDVLSPVGVQQAKVLGEELRRREIRVDTVRCGTLSRQRATAEASVADLTPHEDPRWNEYDHLDLVRRSLPPDAPLPSTRDFQRLLDEALHSWLTDAGTTWPSFRDSARDALDELFASLGRGATALVFTSGGIISAIAAQLLSLPPQGFVAINRTMVNAGLTKLVHGRSGTSLVSLNEHGHFEGPHRELLTYR